MTTNTFNKHLKEKMLESKLPDEIKKSIISNIDLIEYIGNIVDDCAKEENIKISPIEKVGVTTSVFSAIKQSMWMIK